MALSSSIDLFTQLQWYEARDFLLGRNGVKQNVKRALELASTCRHPDAHLLTEIFAGKDVRTKEEARDVFLGQRNEDARLLCFYALLSYPVDMYSLRRSAEQGFALAQSELAREIYVQSVFNDESPSECFGLASSSAAQQEREGFYQLGLCYEESLGCETDLDKAKSLYLVAAQLQHVSAMGNVGSFCKGSDPQRWHWWGLAASRGDSFVLITNFPKLIIRFGSDPSLAPAVFAIGRALKGNFDAEKEEIFGQGRLFSSSIGPANRAVEFFSAQIGAARKAVDMWCLIARRAFSHEVNKDIRKKIGLLIWEARELAEYKESV